jgi:hypothetical protein
MEDKKIEFYKSLDFMKLGQAINRGNWQVAAMTARRMEMNAKNAEIIEFNQQLLGVKQCINRKDAIGAKQILAIMVAKRAKFLNAK